MKILGVYSTDRILGGGEISFTLALTALRGKGVDVLAAVPSLGTLSEYLTESGIPLSVLPQETLREGRSLQFVLRPHPDWTALVRGFRPDIIHCNAIRPALYAQAVGRQLSVPVIMHARKSESDPGIDHFLMRRLNAIVCVSNVVRARFPRWAGSARLRTIYNPIDPSFLDAPGMKSAELRKRWLGSGETLVGVVGRLCPVKGQHLVVEAAPEIIAAVPNVRFAFIGDEDPSFAGHEAMLKKTIGDLGLQHYFTFAGFEADMPSAYHALDIVAFPTTSEGFGRVIIEAGAAGKALVVTELDVLRELLSPGLEDLIVPPYATTLAERIIHLAADREYRQGIAERLERFVRERFTLEAHRDQLLKLYEEVLRG